MTDDLKTYYTRLKKKGLSKEREKKIIAELNGNHSHEEPDKARAEQSRLSSHLKSLYQYNDMELIHHAPPPQFTIHTCLQSIDELLERDKQRQKDGFPQKIRMGRLVKPGRGDEGKIIVVPTTVEEKFVHDNRFPSEEGEPADGGSGEGQEGEVIGEQPVNQPGDQSGTGPGEGEGGAHEIESSAYDLGRILSDKFELPNLKDKGKKRSLTRYTYDMTDRNRGFGQFLDKKATLRQIVETNINIGRLPDVGNIDPSGFLVSPKDKIYRILSREKDYEAQAMVFFLRDYSGSMAGKATEIVVAQHVLIYSWLLYQYEKQVETRFILHDTEAKEVDDFHTYYNYQVAGGTKVFSAFRLVNEIVEKESLTTDYNIYVFHGTDGDDWDTDGKEVLPEIKKMMGYASRLGITIAENTPGQGKNTEVAKYLNRSGFLENKPKLIRMDIVGQNTDEPQLIESIKKLIGE